jgi:hypothetical protein
LKARLAPWIAMGAVAAAAAAVFAWQLSQGSGTATRPPDSPPPSSLGVDDAGAPDAAVLPVEPAAGAPDEVPRASGAETEVVVASLDATLPMVLAPDAPEGVRVLAEHRSFGDLFVLAAVDHSADEDARAETEDEAGLDEAGLDEDGLDEDGLDEDGLDEREPCEEDEDNDDAYCDCMLRTEPSPDRGWRAALGRPVVRIELARIVTSPTGQIVEARATLTGPVIYDAALDVDDPPELRVRDLDGDGRPEVTAIFSVESPDCDTFQEDTGTLGILLDGGDLHVQAAFARSHLSQGGDSDVNTATDETVWRVTDEDADGHGDLAIRRTAHWSETEAEGEPTEGDTSGAWTCPYDVTTDRWACPIDHADAWLATVLHPPSP